MRSFSERFADRVKETGGGEIFMPGARIVSVPDETRGRFRSSGAAIFAHGKTLLDGASKKSAAAVLSGVYFGQYGVGGTVAYSALIEYARGAGMLVICDDRVWVTEENADFVIKAYLTSPSGGDLSETHQIPFEEHGYNADAVTVSAGSDKNGLDRLLKAAADSGREVMTCGADGRLRGLLSDMTV